MKKIIQKFGWLLVISLAAVGIVLYCARYYPFPTWTSAPVVAHETEEVEEMEDTELSLQFRIRESPQAAVFSAYALAEDRYCVFLPSYVELEQVQILMPEDLTASIGPVSLSDGMDCGGFALETEYPLTVNNKQWGTVQFVRSANVPSLYIETATGSMEEIHADQEYEEGATMTLVSGNGDLLHRDGGCVLKGRGNATWISEKKPYLLTLSAEADLLEMGAATKWVLLANTVDETNLRNKLVYDLAGAAGFAWTPQVSFVDVYLNGQYNGLYLLAEKVESGPNRLNLDMENGDFLCRAEVDYRWEILSFPIRPPSGRTLEISEPKQLTTGRKDSIAERVAQMEERIFSGEDLSLATDFDLDSWVRRYLVDEISGNIDADLASSYFYCSDGVIYGGPIWDYDKVFGNTYRNENPEAFHAKNMYVTATITSPYYDALYKNESFQKRLREIYREEFRPLLTQMMDEGIWEQAQYIAQASRMNNLRWRDEFESYYGREEIYPSDVDTLYAHIEKRIAFLDSAWIQGKEFCTIQLEYTSGGLFWNLSVEKGTTLGDSPVDLVDTVWYDYWTGEILGPDTVIDEDRILTVQYNEEKELTMFILARLSLLVMAGMLMVLMGTDWYLRSKERRKDNERTFSKISS